MEDVHSTRGRANYMREILSGKVDLQEFSGKALHDALDLCLECKGCKAECPSNVDMAKLKYEFLAHYNEANGTPLRSNSARIHSLSKMASVWPSLANSVMAPCRKKSLIVTSGSMRVEVCLPSQTQTFEAWFRKRTRPKIAKPAGKVVLFHDTFVVSTILMLKGDNNVVERAGYSGLGRQCCGRPMISKDCRRRLARTRL
jgi:Fe-S oxidoreductase